MVFNATFNNISVISWREVLLVEETGVPGENHRPVAIESVGFVHVSIICNQSLLYLLNAACLAKKHHIAIS
jgi:hypothetical protein